MGKKKLKGPVFGVSLEDLYKRDNEAVPFILTRLVALIEENGTVVPQTNAPGNWAGSHSNAIYQPSWQVPLPREYFV